MDFHHYPAVKIEQNKNRQIYKVQNFPKFDPFVLSFLSFPSINFAVSASRIKGTKKKGVFF